MQAREIMTEEPACCQPMDNVQLAAQRMLENNCGMLPVVDDLQQKHLIGVVTDRDIVCRVLAKDSQSCNTATIQNAMTGGKLWTVHPDTPIDDVLECMEEGQVRRIPVVDDDNKILGVISTADIALELDAPDDVAEVFEEISEPTHIPHA